MGACSMHAASNVNQQPLDEDCVQEDRLEHMFEKEMVNNFLRHLQWC